MGLFGKKEPAGPPPTAAEIEAQRAQGHLSKEEELFKKVSGDHQAAIKAWEKLTMKQKKIQSDGDTHIAKLDKQVKEYESQSDKAHKKIADLRKKQESAAGHEHKNQQKAEAEIAKHEQKLQKAQQKMQTAIAKKEPLKSLYKYQLVIDEEERQIEAARKRAALVPEMTRLEVQDLENKILTLSIAAENDLAKTKLKMREAQYDRDLKLAKLEPDLVQAQLAVQQYEKHLSTHRQDLVAAQQAYQEAEAVAHQPPPPEPEPVQQPEPEPQPAPAPQEPEPEHRESAVGEGEEGRRESELGGEGEEGRRESEFGGGEERRESEFGAEGERRESAFDGEGEELPPVPSVPSAAPAQQ